MSVELHRQFAGEDDPLTADDVVAAPRWWHEENGFLRVNREARQLEAVSSDEASGSDDGPEYRIIRVVVPDAPPDTVADIDAAANIVADIDAATQSNADIDAAGTPTMDAADIDDSSDEKSYLFSSNEDDDIESEDEDGSATESESESLSVCAHCRVIGNCAECAITPWQ